MGSAAPDAQQPSATPSRVTVWQTAKAALEAAIARAASLILPGHAASLDSTRLVDDGAGNDGGEVSGRGGSAQENGVSGDEATVETEGGSAAVAEPMVARGVAVGNLADESSVCPPVGPLPFICGSSVAGRANAIIADLTTKCTVATTRGDSDEAAWLHLDPRRTCDKLFTQRYKAVWSVDQMRIPDPAASLLRLCRGYRHLPHEIAEVLLYVDGGGQRKTPSGISPASWSFVVFTKGNDDSFAFDRAVDGHVITQQDSLGYVGAESDTSMVAEMCGQLHAILFALANPNDNEPRRETCDYL